MKQNEMLDMLFVLLDKGGLSIDSHQKDRIQSYLNLLYTWGKKINLVSKADLNYLPERHIYPGALYAIIINRQEPREKILDFGSGAGLPGVLLAILLKEADLTLLDSNRKKCLFLQQLRKSLGLSFTVVNERMENWAMQAQRGYQVVTARAVASMPELIDYVRPVVSKSGYLLTLKGRDYLKEIKEETPMDGIKITEQDIPKEWIEINPYLKNKCFVKTEFVNG